MPVPKRKTSQAKRDLRRSHHAMTPPGNIRPCPQCSEPMLMHKVCSSCGYYKGTEVIEIPLD